jgi:hypothetical protein
MLASSRAQADEPNVDAELRRLDSYLHAQRGPASAAAFAAFESAIGVLKEDLAKTRKQLPKELGTRFDASVAANVARVVDSSDDYKIADYRCYVSAMRALEFSQQLIVLPVRLKKMDLTRLDIAERQYDDLLQRFESRAKGELGDGSDSMSSRFLRDAGHDVFALGFGIVLSEAQRKELEALLDAQAERWAAATTARDKGKAMSEGWKEVSGIFAPFDRALEVVVTARLATLAWSNKHGKLVQSVREVTRESEQAEVAAIKAAAERESRAPEPKPAEPEPAPLP